MENKYKEEIEFTSKSKFREKENICLVALIFQWYVIFNDLAIIKRNPLNVFSIELKKMVYKNISCYLTVENVKNFEKENYLFVSIQDDFDGNEDKYKEMKNCFSLFLNKQFKL